MFYDSATGQMTMTRNETGDFNNNPEKMILSIQDPLLTLSLSFKVQKLK